jgi:hypothetical protein
LFNFPKTKQLIVPVKDTAKKTTKKLLENDEVIGTVTFLDELRMYTLKERRKTTTKTG